MDENSDKSFDLTNTSASDMNMDGDSEESESLNELEEDYIVIKEKVKEKVKQLGKRVILCIKDKIATDYESDYKDLLIACVGVNFDILDREFKRFMLDVREIFKGLVLQELAPFKEGNVDTENFLMDTIEFQAEKDFRMLKGFEILKRKVTYFVQNPKLFEDFLEIVEDIFVEWDEYLRMMLDLKVKVKKEVKDKLIKREEMLKLYFDKDQKDTESEEGDNLQFTEAGDSEKNGLNEFQELQEENKDEQREEEEEESTEFSSIPQEQEGSQDGEESSVAEDSEEESEGSEGDISSEKEESEEGKTSESTEEEEGGEGDKKEGENKEGEADKKEEGKNTERELRDVDEDGMNKN